MQAIVADTTPLNYLVLIQAADILPNLYRRVLIAPAVKAELAHANTPAIVRAWISQPFESRRPRHIHNDLQVRLLLPVTLPCFAFAVGTR